MGNRDINDSSLERPGVLKDVKVVMVGPAKCGKTALVQRFVNDTFYDSYTPTGFEKYSTRCKIGEFSVDFSIWDTSGSGAYDTIRPLAYQDANVFLLCFNIGDPESLDLAVNKWYLEIRNHCASAPVILCGCRADARNDKETITYLAHAHKMPVTAEQALMASKHVSAVAYVETSSAYVSKAVPEAFELAAQAALGLLNSKKNLPKKKKFGGSQSPLPNKPHIKNEIKGKAKNCCIM
ncbi:hypothetical protein HA402_004805 [Bradysia odoriphaga]|nr:hypothetical protein HA402_004805 [Bradysia odoriphaga]